MSKEQLTEEAVRKALSGVKFPGYSKDIVAFGLVREIRVEGSKARVEIELSTSDRAIGSRIRADSEKALQALPGVEEVEVHVRQPDPGQGPNPWAQQRRVEGVKRILAIASGKGGVGKSTVAANLSCALRRLGSRVGLLDCDIYGPTIPLMMGVHKRPQVSEKDALLPLEGHGVKLMSIGFLVDGDQPVIWRGPLINKAIRQFLFGVEWGELDFLLVDLPPGTGDAQLTLCQAVPLDGGIIVTTPQEASLGVVRKGIAMFEKVQTPVLGIIENMSYYTAPNGERVEIFGYGGGRREAERQGLRFLGEIPIFVEIREGGDAGAPVTAGKPDSPAAKAFENAAKEILKAVGEAS
ncbi:MAG: Mrp/NBP35 family ATP-binding protein [Verrucomicrobia bacterium]|nr:Mrp/NBP35 family ATP-binding protein [Verrucomicrobiota bacterium]